MGSYYEIRPDYNTEADRLGDALDFPLSKEKMKGIIQEAANKEREGHDFWFLIENRDQEVVGNLFTFDCNQRMGTFRYGIDIAEVHQRKGYGAETLYLVLGFFFRELRYQKVTIGVYSFNDKSIKFHEAFGFKREGLLRRMVYTKGSYFDEVYFGLTHEEFDRLYPLIR